MSLAQQTLGGGTTDDERERPDTFVYCPTCSDWLLRSARHDHPHDTREMPADDAAPEAAPPEDDEDDEPEVLGEWYDVELSYSVTYRFNVPARTESDAKAIAKALQLDTDPVDSHHTWSEVRPRGTEITRESSDDVLDELDDLPRYPHI